MDIHGSVVFMVAKATSQLNNDVSFLSHLFAVMPFLSLLVRSIAPVGYDLVSTLELSSHSHLILALYQICVSASMVTL